MVTDVPVLAGRQRTSAASGPSAASSSRASTPPRCARSTTCATLGLDDTSAVFFAFDAEEADRSGTSGRQGRCRVPLEVEEAPYRDLGDPLLDYLRRLTADPDAPSPSW